MVLRGKKPVGWFDNLFFSKETKKEVMHVLKAHITSEMIL